MKFFNAEGLPEIKAGAAKVQIPAPTGVGLAGYYHERIATWIRDGLFAHALLLEREGTTLAFVSVDILCMDAPQADAAKKLIEAQTGIPPQNVLLHATHTHTAPLPWRDALLPHNDEFVNALPQFIAESVVKAKQNMFPALLVPGRETVKDVGSNRLARLRDGSEMFSKGNGIGLAGPVDRELQALRVCDLDGETRAFLVNFAMHPDTIGGGTADFISADWPGEIGKALSQVYGEDVITVFMNGCCGDLNHGLDHPTRRQPRIPHAISMGRAIAGATMAAIEQSEPMESTVLAAQLDYLELPYYTRDAEFLAEVEVARKRMKGWDSALVMSSDAWDHDGKTGHVPVQVLRCGDILFIGLPGEIFTRWGLELKHWSPAPYTFVIEQANANFCYIPTTDQALRGAYGAKPVLSRTLTTDGGRCIADRAQVLMWKLWENA